MRLFSRFIGMITDSRIGGDVRRGLLPDDRESLGRIAQDVSFFNARDYLGIELGKLGRGVGRVAA
jgi:glucuronate isomerase